MPAGVASLLAALLLVGASTSNVRADWLEALPVCAQETPHRTGPTALLYPRPGLAALVRPGEDLVTRVRVAAPLTPPPGHQQEKALRGWSAELRGHRTARADDADHRYRMRVADVRPDSHSTLVYRATVHIPPWLAPGTYDLAVEAPWSGTDIAVASVRVIVGDPVVGYVGGDVDAEALTRLGRLPVDVWWVEPGTSASGEAALARRAALEEPLVGAGIPWVDRGLAGAIFRLGADRAIRVGGCDDPYHTFAQAEQRTIGDAEQLELGPSPAAGHYRWQEQERALASLGASEIDVVSGHWTAPVGTILSLAVPEDGQSTQIEGAEDIRWFPATPLRAPEHRASLVAVFRTTTPSGSWTRRPSEFEVVIEGPERPTAGRESEYMARTADDAQVAWGFMEDGAAFEAANEGVPIRFGQMERQEIHVLAISPLGVAARAQTAVYVESDSPRGCAVHAPGQGRSSNVLLAFGFAFCTIGLARYVRRRSRRE